MSKISKTARASMAQQGPKEKKVIPDSELIRLTRIDCQSGLYPTSQGAHALLRAHDAALALLNQHLSSTYTDLDDGLRQLLQAYITNRDLVKEYAALPKSEQITGKVEFVNAQDEVVAAGVTIGLPYLNTPGDLDATGGKLPTETLGEFTL